jgi:hypothetical protein
LKKLLIFTILTGLLPASVHAQEIQHGRMQSPGIKSDYEKKNDAALDKAYQETLKRTGQGHTVKTDPWGSVRSGDTDTGKR